MDEQGFTLMELLVVIVVMGILGAISIPAFNHVMDSRAVDSAANQLAADLRLAHTRATNQLTDWAAVSNPADVGVPAGAFVAGKDYYLVKIPPVGLPGASDVIGRDLDENGRTQVAAASAPIRLRFKPDGSTRNIDGTSLTGGSVTIRVHKNGGDSGGSNRHDIEIAGSTSRVQIDP